MDDFLDQIEEALNNGNYAKWVGYAKNNLNMTKVLREYEAKDIVNIVITKTLDQDRTFKEELPIDIYMKNTIRSVVSDLKNKKLRNGFTLNVEEDDYEKFSIEKGQVITEKELHEDADYHELFKIIEDQFKDDDSALLVLYGWKERKNNIEIAEDLGLTAQEVSNIKRRIKYISKNKLSKYYN